MATNTRIRNQGAMGELPFALTFRDGPSVAVTLIFELIRGTMRT